MLMLMLIIIKFYPKYQKVAWFGKKYLHFWKSALPANVPKPEVVFEKKLVSWLCHMGQVSHTSLVKIALENI